MAPPYANGHSTLLLLSHHVSNKSSAPGLCEIWTYYHFIQGGEGGVEAWLSAVTRGSSSRRMGDPSPLYFMLFR